jgi:hypothetical protein
MAVRIMNRQRYRTGAKAARDENRKRQVRIYRVTFSGYLLSVGPNVGGLTYAIEG